MVVHRSILSASLALAALAATAEPSVLVERDPITDAVTSTVEIYGTFLSRQGFGETPSIRVVCSAPTNLGEWIEDDQRSELGTHRTVVLVDLPGSDTWDYVASGVVRFDQHEPFNVETMFLRSFEGFTLDTPLVELAKTTTVAIRIADHTAVFEMTGLRAAMLQTPNKCGWDSLRIPSADET